MVFETNWEIDFRKELKKYEYMDKMSQKDANKDSRFYKKHKENISLKDDGRVYIPGTFENANL